MSRMMIAAAAVGTAASILAAATPATANEYTGAVQHVFTMDSEPAEDTTYTACVDAAATNGAGLEGASVNGDGTMDLTVRDGSPLPFRWESRNGNGELEFTCYVMRDGRGMVFVY